MECNIHVQLTFCANVCSKYKTNKKYQKYDISILASLIRRGSRQPY